MSEENNQLRNASGNVEINSKLVSFLYSLMRDYIPAGDVEQIMRESQDPSVQYTNGWLANYAEYIAGRLKDTEKEGAVAAKWRTPA